MRFFAWLFITAALPLTSFAQYSTYVGLNFTPLIIKTYEAHLEKRVTKSASLEVGTGFRLQNRELNGELILPAMKSYVAKRNFGAFVTVGGRIYNWDKYEYPYFGLHLIASYYNEDIVFARADSAGVVYDIRPSKGVSFGVSGVLGMVLNLPGRFKLDIAGQMTYHKVRDRAKDAPPNYYLAGMGYNTYATSFEIPSLLFQPVVTLKYDIVKNRRDELRKQE